MIILSRWNESIKLANPRNFLKEACTVGPGRAFFLNRSIFLAFYPSYKSANGRTLGFRGQNSVVNPNLGSVRSGRLGLESYEPRLIFRVWARKSLLRAAWGNMTSDSNSTQNFG